MRLLYTVGIWFYTLGIRVAALFGHAKARLMVQGWKTEEERGKWNGERGSAWFHASSLGEFEQARPVLEEYRRRHPDSRVVVTFFSPSGYEVRKGYPLADAVLYLPPDLPHRARRFLDTYRPTVAFFVKYDFWYNCLGELRRRGVPTYLFSAIFRPGQYFFRPWGGWFRRQLNTCFAHLFVQNEESQQLLRSHGIEHCSLAGDTRYDRVHQIAQAAQADPVVERWLEGCDGKVLVCGSTWPPDEELIARWKAENGTCRVIVAPHVISEEHLQSIKRLFPDSVRYSSLKNQGTQNQPGTLVIDNIGLLSRLYRYADVAYIGGGFGAGIHNILEAVAFGKPVLFGPNYQKFQEAHSIIDLKGGWSHRDYDGFVSHLNPLLADGKAYNDAVQACQTLMQRNLGCTDKILATIEA